MLCSFSRSLDQTLAQKSIKTHPWKKPAHKQTKFPKFPRQPCALSRLIVVSGTVVVKEEANSRVWLIDGLLARVRASWLGQKPGDFVLFVRKKRGPTRGYGFVIAGARLTSPLSLTIPASSGWLHRVNEGPSNERVLVFSGGLVSIFLFFLSFFALMGR